MASNFLSINNKKGSSYQTHEALQVTTLTLIFQLCCFHNPVVTSYLNGG